MSGSTVAGMSATSAGSGAAVRLASGAAATG